jgi:hypothetical protein
MCNDLAQTHHNIKVTQYSYRWLSRPAHQPLTMFATYRIDEHEMRSDKLGADHLSTLTSMANLALTWRAQLRLERLSWVPNIQIDFRPYKHLTTGYCKQRVASSCILVS